MGIQQQGLCPNYSHFPKSLGVCVSNVLTPDGVVEVYDSLPPICNNTLTGQVAATMQCSSQEFTVRWVNVQLQSGGDDCALFAVAFAEALCTGRDPHVLSFNQSQMRHHLKLRIAHVAYLGTSKERWHSVSLVRSGSTRIVYTFLMPFSWTLCLFGHAVTVSSFSKFFFFFFLSLIRNSRSK